MEKIQPKFFAVAPEFDITDYRAMNAGVMLMNLKNLREQDDAFRKFISNNLEKLVDMAWDQGAYRTFYHKMGVVQRGNKKIWSSIAAVAG